MESQAMVLIVDDEPSARQVLELMLAPEGYQLAFAENGADALAIAKVLRPDLVLCDVMMPGLDGFEVCRALRNTSELAEVPVILVTALDDRSSKLQGLEAGADDFVTKPYDRAELKARVRTTTRLNRYRRLVDERARLTWVMEHSRDGYVTLNEDGVIQYANQSARQYLGIPTEASAAEMGKFLDRVTRQFQLQPLGAWDEWLGTGDLAGIGPLYLVRPESQVAAAFWLQVDRVRGPEASQHSVVLQLCDVTAQIATQRDWVTFGRILAHKLRTPAAQMLTALQLLTTDIRNWPKADVSGMVQVAHDAAERLNSLLEDVLEYVNVPRLAEPSEAYPLNVLDATLRLIGRRLNLSHIVLSMDEPLLLQKLPLTGRSVEVIFWQILENAQKFHPATSPMVTVTVSELPESRVQFQIQDDGIWLSPRQLMRAWVPYYQGERQFTGEVAGTGLGLSVVAALVWNTGGTCRLYNRPDRPGVTVELILPLA